MRHDEVAFYYPEICELVQLESKIAISHSPATICTNSEIIEYTSSDEELEARTNHQLIHYITFDNIIRDRHRSIFSFDCY